MKLLRRNVKRSKEPVQKQWDGSCEEKIGGGHNTFISPLTEKFLFLRGVSLPVVPPLEAENS